MGIKEHASSAPGHEPMHWSTLHEAAEQTGMATMFWSAHGSRPLEALATRTVHWGLEGLLTYDLQAVL